MSLIMNGKEVNHLIVSGEQFDKSYVGKRGTLVSTNNVRNIYLYNRVNTDGSGDWGQVNGSIPTAVAGDQCDILAAYKDMFYIANVGVDWHGSVVSGPGCGQGWVPKSNVKLK